MFLHLCILIVYILFVTARLFCFVLVVGFSFCLKLNVRSLSNLVSDARSLGQNIENFDIYNLYVH